MTPDQHAALSCRDFSNGDFSNIPVYLPIHLFLDMTKGHVGDSRHRLFLHNSFGMLLAEMIYGYTVTDNDGNIIPVREIARRHILEDCSEVPSLKDIIETIHESDYLKKYNKPRRKDIDWLQSNYHAAPVSKRDQIIASLHKVMKDHSFDLPQDIFDDAIIHICSIINAKDRGTNIDSKEEDYPESS